MRENPICDKYHMHLVTTITLAHLYETRLTV